VRLGLLEEAVVVVVDLAQRVREITAVLQHLSQVPIKKYKAVAVARAQSEPTEIWVQTNRALVVLG